MKRACLKQIGIREFKEEGKFQDPSLELIIPQITWDNCQTSCNLNICKDYNNSAQGWVCQECRKWYKTKRIEKVLIEIVNARVIAHQIQDFECNKCKLVKENLLGSMCSCTGIYKNTNGDICLKNLQNKNLLNSHSDVQILLELIKNIARRHQMKMLYRIVLTKQTFIQ